MRPRVAVVEINEDGTTGGSHRILDLLVRGLETPDLGMSAVFYQHNPVAGALARDGFDVHVLDALRERERRVNREGSRPARLAKAADAVRQRARWLRRHDITVVHLNNSPFAGYDDWLPAARLVGARCIVTAMTRVTPEDSLVRRMLAPRFDRILPVSTWVADSLTAHGIPRSRQELVPLGVDLDALRASRRVPRQEVRAALGASGEQVVVVMVGNLRRWKGQHVLLDAVARLPEPLRHRLAIWFAGAASAGDEPYRLELEQQARALAPVDVRFLGMRGDVPDLLGGADIAIHASVEAEPFGLVLVEAMALGVPIIASALGGPTDIIADGSGILVPPGDGAALAGAIAGLVADPAARERLASRGRERAERYSATALLETHRKLYQRLL